MAEDNAVDLEDVQRVADAAEEGATKELSLSRVWFLSGMRGFTAVWAGQLVSLLGTSMTNFAVIIWAWEKTGVATALALVGFSFVAPYILMSPFAGALVDRWNRKLVMMLSDLAAGLSTLAVLLLFTTGMLEIWHLYVTTAFAGAFQAFQFPAFSAAVTLMLDKEQYARANGMMSLANSASNIFAPVAAGILLPIVGIGGIMTFDVLSFVVAIGTLMVIHVPQPSGPAVIEEKKRSFLEDSMFGFRYILSRRSLLGLQLIFFVANFTGSISFSLLAPMILSRTGNGSLILGSVQSAFGVGGVVGGLIMSAWGGPKRRVNGLLLGLTTSSLLGTVVMGLGRSAPFWIAAAFMFMFVNPITNGCSQSIWQSKVPPELQGRVFSTRALIAQASQPIAMFIAGPIADRLMEPAMMPGGALAPVFGWLVGTGPGAGMALIFLAAGLIGSSTSLGGYAFDAVRNVEDIIPDHDSVPKITENPSKD
jgi:DHA3 family macrolide efflux protein-like MFS transporter